MATLRGQLAYNGKATHDWISKEDKSSPTVPTQSIHLLSAVDNQEDRDVLSMDVPNAFIQTLMPHKDDGERVITKSGVS